MHHCITHIPYCNLHQQPHWTTLKEHPLKSHHPLLFQEPWDSTFKKCFGWWSAGRGGILLCSESHAAVCFKVDLWKLNNEGRMNIFKEHSLTRTSQELSHWILEQIFSRHCGLQKDLCRLMSLIDRRLISILRKIGSLVLFVLYSSGLVGKPVYSMLCVVRCYIEIHWAHATI